MLELSAPGTRGDTIARARDQAIDILQNGNACAAWFQEADPDPAEVFRSLHFELGQGAVDVQKYFRACRGDRINFWREEYLRTAFTNGN